MGSWGWVQHVQDRTDPCCEGLPCVVPPPPSPSPWSTWSTCSYRRYAPKRQGPLARAAGPSVGRAPTKRAPANRSKEGFRVQHVTRPSPNLNAIFFYFFYPSPFFFFASGRAVCCARGVGLLTVDISTPFSPCPSSLSSSPGASLSALLRLRLDDGRRNIPIVKNSQYNACHTDSTEQRRRLPTPSTHLGAHYVLERTLISHTSGLDSNYRHAAGT